MLEKEIDKIFPDSFVLLRWRDDKLAVIGEAVDLDQALQILRMVGKIVHGDEFGTKYAPCSDTLESAGGPNVISRLRVLAPNAKRRTAVASAKGSTMNLADVVAMSISGVSDDIIVNQLRTTEASFTLGAEEIIWLKANNVSDQVVIALQNSRPTKKPVAEQLPELVYPDRMPESLRMPLIDAPTE